MISCPTLPTEVPEAMAWQMCWASLMAAFRVVKPIWFFFRSAGMPGTFLLPVMSKYLETITSRSASMTSQLRARRDLFAVTGIALALATALVAPIAQAEPGYQFFQSPSGNISCVLRTFSDHGTTRATAACQIGRYDYQ